MIDCHTHIGWDDYKISRNSTPQKQTAEELVEKIGKSGIEKAITFPFPFTSYFDLSTVRSKKMKKSGKMNSPYEDQNLYVLKSAETHKQIIPFLAICLGKHSNFKQVKEIIETSNVIKGLKLHSRFSRSHIKELIGSKFMKLAEDKELSLMIHTDSENIPLDLNFNYFEFSDPMQLIKVSEKHPNVNLGGAHLGWLSKRFLEQASKKENVFLDTSPFLLLCNLPWRANDAIKLNYKNPKEAMLKLCMKYQESMIWGSDEPYTEIASKTLSDEKDLLDCLGKKIVKRISEKNTKKYLYNKL